MPSVSEAREARRRRILERGSDRLDYITGKLPSINSPPSSSLVESTQPNVDSIVEPRTSASIHSLDENTPGRSGEFDALRVPHEFDDVPNENRKSTSFDQKLTEEKNASIEVERLKTFSLTWDKVGCSIEITQKYRALGAFFIALFLVVQSCSLCVNLKGFSVPTNFVLPWPVAMVILSDISLVAGAFLLGLLRTRDTDIPDVSFQQDQFSQLELIASNLGSLFVAGTVMLNASQALFLDCSIYVVVLICGYSLAQICR